MWQYFWAHSVYHLMRWFPANNRLKVRVVLLIFTFALLVPQIYVLALPQTSQYCGWHLLDMLIVSVVFTFFMIGFSILFSIMDPVPWQVKLGFHVFGGACFVAGVILTAFTAQAEDCRVSTEGLYYLSIAVAVLAAVTMAFFALLVPCWLMNRFGVCRNKALDRRARDGFCYEAVSCCSCIWHV